MTYSEFLTQFIRDLSAVLTWLRTRIMPTSSSAWGSSLFSNHLIFTIMGIGFFTFLIEELVGILTSMRFGGFFIRLWRIFFPRAFRIADEFPNYSKENKIRPIRPFYRAFYRQKYNGKYFIQYNGRYYPFKVNRFNPFSIMAFNSQLKAGNLISYDELYKGSRVDEYHGSFMKGIFNDIWKKSKDYHYPNNIIEDKTKIPDNIPSVDEQIAQINKNQTVVGSPVNLDTLESAELNRIGGYNNKD